jgi:formiminotetrahydrofolate cyclodeaminase
MNDANSPATNKAPGAGSGDSFSLADALGGFAELVAEGTPTPGGGSVAAHSGMLAAALGRMVCNITIGKPKYAAVEDRLKQINAELEQLGTRLRELIVEDAASFELVRSAYRLPKETEDERAERRQRIESATWGAINTPLDTARRSLEVLRLLGEVATIGNPNALSDVAVGGRLAETAVCGAFYNVAINLGSITDRERASEVERQTQSLVKDAEAISREIESRLLTQT